MSSSKKRAHAHASSASAAAALSGKSAGSAFGFPSHARDRVSSPLSYFAEPPDIKSISDPNLVVVFSNLLKRDDTTKEKAVAELLDWVTEQASIENAVVNCYVQLYPKLSFENTIRIRHLAHKVLGTIADKTRRAFRPYLPQVAGSWLAGLYDSDQSVSAAATDALRQVFTTDEKIALVWKTYQMAIMDFCSKVKANEQVNTLSDERNNSPDEMEAKFARVMKGITLAVAHLVSAMAKMGAQEAKHDEAYLSFINEPRLWTFAYHSDPHLRLAVYSLLRTCLVNRKDYIEPALHIIAPAMIDKALVGSQLGSNQRFLDTLLTMNETFPSSWEIAATVKKPTFKVVKRYVSKGSQGAPAEFWSKFTSLVQTLPEKALPSINDEVQLFLKAVVDGLSGSMEPKDHRPEAWSCYFHICAFLLSKEFLKDEIRKEIISVNIGNTFKEFLEPQEALAAWRIGLVDPPAILAKAMKVLTEVDTAFVKENTNNLITELGKQVEVVVDGFITAEGSAVESHMATVDAWTRLTSALYHTLDRTHWPTPTLNTVEEELLRHAVASSRATQGKNIAAAALVASIAKAANSSVRRHCRPTLHEYLVDDSRNLVASPSREHFFHTLFAYQKHWDSSNGHGILEETLDLLVISQDRESILQFMYNFERSHTKACVSSANLDGYLRQECDKALADAHEPSWKMLIVAFKAPESLVSRQLKADMAVKLVEKLHAAIKENAGDHHLTSNILTELSRIPAVVLGSIDAQSRRDLIGILLLILSTADDDSIKKADILFVKLCGEKNLNDPEINQIRIDIVKVLHQHVIQPATEGFINIRLLMNKALCVLSHADISREAQLMTTMSYDDDTWRDRLLPVFDSRPDAALSALQPLGDCSFLVNASEDSEAEDALDHDGLSASMRMAIFMLSMLAKTDMLNAGQNASSEELQKAVAVSLAKLSPDLQWPFLRYSLVVAEVIADRLAIPVEKAPLNLTVLRDLATSLTLTREVAVHNYKKTEDLLAAQDGKINFTNYTLLRLSEQTAGQPVTCEAYYHARALRSLVDVLRHKGVTGKDAILWVDRLGIGKAKDDKFILRDAAVLSGLRDDQFTAAPFIVQLRNRLISDISGIEAEDAVEKAFPKLLILNEMWTSDLVENPVDVPAQRGLLLMKKVLGWLNEELPPEVLAMQCPGLLSSIMRMSRKILPSLAKLTGSHWQDLFAALEFTFSVCFGSINVHRGMRANGKQALYNSLGETVSVTLAAFAVYEAVKEIRATNREDEFVNDDLSDQWDWFAPRFYRIWLGLLTDIAAPLRNEGFKQYCAALSRALMNMPLQYLDDPAGVGPRPSVSWEDRDEDEDKRPQSEQLYYLMGGNTDDVQGIAFNLLHRRIPELQEQVSIDAALSKDEAVEIQLPAELLSLLLDPPFIEDEAMIHPTVLEAPELQKIQGYLCSWVLVYDHFVNASFRIKAAYIESLKTGEYIAKLLNFVFAFLGHARAKPIDGSKYPVASFDPALAAYQAPDIHYVRTLMIYVYYLSLRYSPSLAKGWFNDANNQVKATVEPFTDKFISPMLVDLEFKEVERWLTSGDERPEGLSIKISRTAREVTLTYEVDDTTMEMMVKLPASFPLQAVEVKGVRRVAVSEKLWKKWLLACQAVIALQGGSIVDGLTLFQRNMRLHLDGVEECAICYSILAQVERTLPSKACQTCKRKFHGSCLMRWFKSSSSSSCPLCRSSFQFV
ncbi:E3 ubiquitin-protein ligase [Drechslerella dactyloides]|uniref:E3 ubiquitin-protein ligase listerin n=1 Tax=Drechslerella dactyloides TaxID=74499 RepID=A0AAD6NFF6_DREDA|nr:E3 ubiquitin-protein ligase [Drechslerella dactyloides]